MSWEPGPGVVELPDGVRLRGRALRSSGNGLPEAEWTLLLLGAAPAGSDAPGRWLRWLDFWLPSDRDEARSCFEEAHRRAANGLRVEVACGGGRGRTGTALACIAQLGGVPPGDAVAWVRRNYGRRAVETPWQRRYVRRFLG